MSNVIVKDNESLDSALRRFKRNCAKAAFSNRKREHYEKPSVRRKKKSEAAQSITTRTDWSTEAAIIIVNMLHDHTIFRVHASGTPHITGALYICNAPKGVFVYRVLTFPLTGGG